MAGDVRVVEDGVEGRQATRRPTPPWVWMLVGLLIGIGFSVVFLTPSSSTPEPEPTAEVTPPPDVPSLEGPIESVGVADRVPDFPDAMVAVTKSDGLSLEHLIWPVSGDPRTRALPAWGEADFDASGTWLAIATPLPDADGSVLSMGKPVGVAPLASDVTSFAWHDDESATLTYTQVHDGGWDLWVVRADRNPNLVASGVVVQGEVSAWGDWGWAIGNPEIGVTTLLTENGEIKGTQAGVVLDSHPNGWMVVDTPDGLHLLSAGGGLRSLQLDVESIGGANAAAISPDGDHVAVVGGAGLMVKTIGDDGPTLEAPFTAPLSKVSWSSDSRFVIIPFLRGVVIIDTVEGGRSFEDLADHTVVSASVIPLNR